VLSSATVASALLLVLQTKVCGSGNSHTSYCAIVFVVCVCLRVAVDLFRVWLVGPANMAVLESNFLHHDP
jgi:hypothetical protein